MSDAATVAFTTPAFEVKKHLAVVIHQEISCLDIFGLSLVICIRASSLALQQISRISAALSPIYEQVTASQRLLVPQLVHCWILFGMGV